MNTPYYIIGEDKLGNTLELFRLALKQYWPNSRLAYSVKTNSLPWLLEYLRSFGVMAEVVSDEEYELALMCGYRDDGIVFNGPIKSNGMFARAVSKGAIVNMDSKNELEIVGSSKPDQQENLGLRINISPDYFEKSDVDYTDSGFRFGFSDDTDELGDAIKLLKQMYGNRRFGLHFHCNSITRSVRVYKAIADYAAELVIKYSLKPSYIDLGGGFFGGMEGKPTPNEYLSEMAARLKPIININDTTLIIEPGTAIIGAAVDYYTRVIDVKDTKHSRIVTTDGSRLHIDPLWMKKNYMYSIQSKERIIFERDQIICGYTCMDHDRIMRLSDAPELRVGDEIIYHRVGAYTMTFGGPFIRYYPDVYVDTGNDQMLVRRRTNVEQYYQIQSVDGEKS